MIPKPIESITADDIHALVAAGFEKGPRLDFKRDLPKDDSEGRKALYADICAFANSAGGDLVYGIQEGDGVAKEVMPLTLPMRASSYVERTCGLPMVIRVALLGANDLRFGSGHPRELAGSTHSLPIRQPLPMLCLPDALLESVDQPLEHLLHGTFLRMWLAWGYTRSYFYTQVDGVWTRQDN